MSELLDSLTDGVYFVDRHGRITYWSRRAEEITGYPATEVVGSRCADQILVHVNAEGEICCGAACPLAGARCGAKGEPSAVYLLHKNGHRVPVQVRALALCDGAGQVTGAVEIFTDLRERIDTQARLAELEQMAYLDPLTRTANRRYLDQHLAARLQELVRFDWPFGVVMFDIDHFKEVNDRFGHEVGDRTLCMVAQSALGNTRPFDLVARLGGEEFVQVVGHVRHDELREVGERLCRLVRHSVLRVGAQLVSVTISAGVTMAAREDSAETLLRRADALLYESKRQGRDRVSYARS